MEIHGMKLTKSLEELRKSSYHQQLGRKICAAFVAQQQGTKLDTAFRKLEEPVGDLWLAVAEMIRLGTSAAGPDDANSPSNPIPKMVM
jgi:hypothetical protein